MTTSWRNLQETTNVTYVPARPLVLVADDHADTRLLFRTVLEDRGYGIIEAADGEETVLLAETEHPDLILMDGSLPLLSGLEATRRIRKSTQNGRVPIVFISGHSGATFVALARDAGCDDYLVKPLTLAQLEDTLKKYCDITSELSPFDLRRSVRR